jgi:hypothetical protein
MNKDWLNKCEAFANTACIPEARAIQLSVLIWANKNCGPIEDFDSAKYNDFALILEGSSPWPGKFVKSADRKKVKGVPRLDTDPTCYTFQEFWKDYGYKTGKPGSEEIWALYDEAKRGRIKDHLPGYVLKTTTSKAKAEYGEFKPARAMPQSYLRDKDCKYWKGDFEVMVRDTSIPEQGEFRYDYNKYWERTKVEFPTLSENSFLSYQEYSNLRNKSWESEFKVNLGTSILKEIVDQAHHTTLDKGGLVYEHFITALRKHI